MKIVIAGAGITGLSVAQMLQPTHEVTVLEAQQKGGLIRCETHQGHLYHLVGGHVFNSRNQKVLNWFWSYFNRETEFLKATRKARIWLGGQQLGYPIENYLYRLPTHIAQKIIAELLQRYKPHTHTSFSDICKQYPNFEAFLQGNFGPTLYELYFRPYNQKIWQRPLHQIALPWLEGKLPMPNVADIMQQNILRQEEDHMVHSSFYYPIHGGSQFIVERLSAGLHILENTALASIEYKNGKLLLNKHKQANELVYTGDIRKLPALLQSEVLQRAIVPYTTAIAALQSNGTTNVLVELNNDDYSWMYLPEPNVLPHRIIYTGNFSARNNGNNERKSATIEFSGILADKDILPHLNTLPGQPKALKIHRKEASYVIHKADTALLIRNIKAALAPFGIRLLGRFAEWEYYNMDKCIEAAMAYKAYLDTREIKY